LCGDFNSEPWSVVYQLLAQSKIEKTNYNELIKEYGELNIPSMQELQHDLGFVSAYPNEPKFTNYTAHYKGTLDYVLYSKEKLTCLSHLEEVEETQLSKEMALPNSIHSSDHVPLMAEFAYNDDVIVFRKEMSQLSRSSGSSTMSTSPTNRNSPKRGNNEKIKVKSKPSLSSSSLSSSSSQGSVPTSIAMNKNATGQGNYRQVHAVSSLPASSSYPFLEDGNRGPNRNGMNTNENMTVTPPNMLSVTHSQPSTAMYANPNLAYNTGADYANYPAYDYYDRMARYNPSARYGYYDHY